MSKCPSCGNNHLQVSITQWADVEFGDEGHDVTNGPYGDLEWDDDSTAICCGCGWSGTLKQCETNDKPTHVQLMPTVDGGNHVRIADPSEEPNQWSVYLGRPGAFEWQADFRDRIVAECFALKLCADHGANLIRGNA